MLTARRRAGAIGAVIVLGTALALSGATAAQAVTTSNLPPGSVICTDKIRSDKGIAFYGFVRAPIADSTALWTVRAGTTADGPDAPILRLTSGEPSTTYASWPGTLYYRLCVTQTQPVTAAGRWNHFAQPGANAAGAFGPYTATLGSGGYFCGPSTASPARIVGTSNVPVRWTVDVENGDGDFLRTIDLGTSTALDQLLTPGDNEYFNACVRNTSSTPATLSLDLT